MRVAFLFAKKRRCAIFAFASGRRRFYCLYTEKRKNIFAADGDNTAFFVPAWRRRTAFVYLYAGTAIVWAGSYRRVAVFRQGRCAEVRTLIDTGNGLKQADDRGVAILEMQAVLPLFSAEEGMRLLSGSREGLEWLAFSSLGNPNGRLWGIRAEKLILFFGEKSICHRDIFVGIAEEAFTGSYEGIVPPSLWKEDSE